MKLYKSYNFVDKDPIIDELRTMIQATEISYKEIERRSGVATATLNAWFKGRTKRPQAATVRAVARCMGADLTLVVWQEPAAVVAEARPPRKQDWRKFTQKPHKGVRR